jgi:nucleotide-binding universal stress UspA family protein
VRAVVWIVEGTWEQAVDAARELLPGDAEVELVHVSEVAALAHAGRSGLLGRHPPPRPDVVSAASEEEAEALLGEAAARLGRPAVTTALRGRAQDAVLDAASDADVLVLVRDGERGHRGPKSIGHATRFILDHAACDVVLARVTG